jgi:hypothetical protein
MSKKDTEQEERDLRGWLADELPMNAQIGNTTKGEIIQKLKQIIEENSKLTYKIEE